ncbi:MAG: hypothetical protein H6508_06700 [Calditrichaeota bacterium]|nr:hypothetical protein [Calditrichota bacterium]
MFRYRSYLPLLLVPFGVWQLSRQTAYVGNSEFVDRLWDFSCLGLALVGSLIRFLSVGYAQSGTSGRNTSAGQIADGLNQKGMYSLCRHPLYLGNLIIYSSVLLFTKSGWFAAAGSLALFLYYERIIATEEAYLIEKFGNGFTDWASRTPCLIPSCKNWVKPGLSFSMKAGLRSEFYSVVAAVVTFFILDLFERYFVEGVVRADTTWTILLVFSLATFFVLRHLRKHTNLLNETAARFEH